MRNFVLLILLLAQPAFAGYFGGGGSSITANSCPGGQVATGIATDGTLTCGSGSGTGDVAGPASSTDNGFARFDGTSGVLLQDTGTGASLSDAGTATFAQVIDSGLNASQAVVTNGSKQLASLAYASANTASALVQRDGSSNFSAGTITADLTGNVTGNVTGAVTGNADTATALAANPSDCGANTYATTIAANGNLTCASITNASTTATASNTNSTIMLRDGSGQVAATTFTGALAGNATTATALAVNPTACGAGDFVTDIAANGTLTCATPAGGSGVTIDSTAIMSGTANRVLFENASNQVSESASLTFASSTLSTVNAALSGYVNHTDISTPATPSASNARWYGASGIPTYVNSSGTVKKIGADAVAVGQPISGATTTRVLYSLSGNIADSADLTYSAAGTLAANTFAGPLAPGGFSAAPRVSSAAGTSVDIITNSGGHAGGTWRFFNNNNMAFYGDATNKGVGVAAAPFSGGFAYIGGTLDGNWEPFQYLNLDGSLFISPNITRDDVPTRNYSMMIHGPAATATYTQYALLTTTGTGSGDGTLVGLDTGGHFNIKQQEALSIKFSTSGTLAYTINSSGVLQNNLSASESTGAGTALLGTNSPAVTNSAPYTWLKILTSDSSTGYVPVWK